MNKDESAVKLRQASWEDVPNPIHLEGTRVKELLSKHCRGPYNEKGIRIVLRLILEGRMGAPFKKDGVMFEPLANDIAAARICIKKCYWDVRIPAYRRFLWVSVRKAILGCGERIQKRGIAVDREKLALDLSKAEVEYLGSPILASDSRVHNDIQDSMESEDHRLVIQYRVAGHGNLRDLDRRNSIETLIGAFLESKGLGRCDGGDIGSGAMNVFCDVKPGRGAGKKIIEVLWKNNLLEGAIVAENVEGEQRVIWPPDFKGEFQLIYR